MGDFYEMFFADAEAASAALDIALTKRGQHLGEDIPMCGVPVHAAEGYLLTLIRKGFRVAVCEQMEDPAEARKRGAKSVVRREVVRLVTPGTLTEDSLLEARRHNYLAAFAEVRGEGALRLGRRVHRRPDGHAVPAGRAGTDAGAAGAARGAGRRRARARAARARRRGGRGGDAAGAGELRFERRPRRGWRRRSGRASSTGSASFGRAELGALGAIVDYLELTQRGRLPLLRPPVRERAGGLMAIDAATRRNLELTRSLAGGREGSLLGDDRPDGDRRRRAAAGDAADRAVDRRAA